MTTYRTATQVDSSFLLKIKALDTIDILKTDTMPPPNDALTAKIRIMRQLKTGLDVTDVLLMKIQEEKQKDTSKPKGYYDDLASEIQSGRTSTLLENSIINVHKRSYTEAEIDDLIKFYKTSAGKKFQGQTLLILVETAKSGEQLLKMYAEKKSK